MMKRFDRINSRAANGCKETVRLTALAMALTAVFSFVPNAGAASLHAFPSALHTAPGLQVHDVANRVVSNVRWSSTLQFSAAHQLSFSYFQTITGHPESVSGIQPLPPSSANEDSLVKASLITEFDQVQPGQTLLIGVHLNMVQDWYVYWQNPGDSGIPTSVRWNMPDRFETGDLKWPYPTNFYTDSFISHGYKDEVVLLTELNVPDDAAEGETVNLTATVSWLVCKDVCIPGGAEISRGIVVSHSAGRPNADSEAADSADNTDVTDVANNSDSDSETNTDTEASTADAGSIDGYTDKELIRKFKARLPQALPGLNVGFRTQSNSLILDLQHEKLRGADTSELVFYASDEGIVESGAEQHFEITEGGLRITLRKSVFAGGDIQSVSGVLYNSSGWDENGTGIKAIYVTSRE